MRNRSRWVGLVFRAGVSRGAVCLIAIASAGCSSAADSRADGRAFGTDANVDRADGEADRRDGQLALREDGQVELLLDGAIAPFDGAIEPRLDGAMDGQLGGGNVEGWMCEVATHADGVCDCGCGVADPDCGGEGCTVPGCRQGACRYCHESAAYETVCGPAASGTPRPIAVCAASWSVDDRCDCGCGTLDPVCAGASCATPGCTAASCEVCHDATGAPTACERTVATVTATETRDWRSELDPVGAPSSGVFRVQPDGTLVMADSTSVATRPAGGQWSQFDHGLRCVTNVLLDGRGRAYLTCDRHSRLENTDPRPILWEVRDGSVLPEPVTMPLTGSSGAWAFDVDARGFVYVLMSVHPEMRCDGELLMVRPPAASELEDPSARASTWTATCLGRLARTGNAAPSLEDGTLSGFAAGRELWLYNGTCAGSTTCPAPLLTHLVGDTRSSVSLATAATDTRRDAMPYGHVVRIDASGRVHVAWYSSPSPAAERWRIYHSERDPRTAVWTHTVLVETPATSSSSPQIAMELHPTTGEPQIVAAYAARPNGLSCTDAYAWRRRAGSWQRSSLPSSLCTTVYFPGARDLQMGIDSTGRLHVHAYLGGTPTQASLYLHD